MMDETIVKVENYEEVVGAWFRQSIQSDNRTGDAAPFKDPTPN